MIDGLRAVAAVTWLVACICLLVPMLRALFRPAGPTDPWKAITFFCGLLFFAFPSRSMVRPSDDAAREALFVLSILLAVTVIGMAWREWWGRRP